MNLQFMILIYTHFVRQSYYIMKHSFIILIYTHFVRQSYYITNQGLHKSFLRRIDTLELALRDHQLRFRTAAALFQTTTSRLTTSRK